MAALNAEHSRINRHTDAWYEMSCASADNLLEADNYAAARDLQNEMQVAKDRIRQRIQDDMNALKQEKHESDVTLAMWVASRGNCNST